MGYLASSTILLLWLTFAAAGGVVPVQFYAACLVFAILAAMQVLRWMGRPSFRMQAPSPYLSIPAALLVSYMVLQCAPLPSSWVLAFWPERQQALESLSQAQMLSQSSWHTISLRPAATVDLIILVMAALCVFLIAYALIFRSSLTLRSLLLVVAFLGIAQACFALTLATPESSNGVATGSFVNRNHFACLMGVALPIVIALGWQSGIEALHDEFRAFRNALISVFWLACAGLLIFALVLSQSRGGFIAALCGLITCGLLFVLRMHGSRRKYTLLVLGSVVAVFALALPSPQLAGRFLQQDATDGVSVQTRIEIWTESLNVIHHHWVLGVGAGAFEDAFVSHNRFAAGKRVDYAHNDYLQALIELGVVGMIPLLLLGGSIFWSFATALRTASGNTLLFLQAATGSLVSFSAHEIVEFNLAIPVLVLLVAWIAGAVCGQAVLLDRAESPRHHSFSIDIRKPHTVSLRGGVAEA